ncbi:MAG: YdbH domain-containing protein [Gammaproteobacteria bacterium]|nr:YdbH domain-containing protein [Gammaproteobacteria bacterium]
MPRLLLITQLLFAISMTASAAPSGVLTGAVESVAAATWRIDGLEFELFLSESGLAASTRIAQISLLESGQKFDDIVVACERIAMSSVAISCQAATFTATLPAVGRQTVRGSFVHARRDSVTDVVLENVAIAAGIARIEIRATDDELDVRFSSPELQLDGLLDAAIALGAELSDYTAAGTTALTGRLRTLAGGGLHIELVTQFSGTSISNNAGTIAAEGLAGKLLLDLTEHGDVLQFDLEIESNSGEAYLEPVYANFSEHALALRAGNVSSSDLSTFAIADFEMQQESLLQLDGEVTISLATEPATPTQLSGSINLTETSVDTLYTSLLQVAMAGTVLGDLETAGTVSGAVVIANNALSSARLALSDLVLDDRQGRFAVYGLNGDIDWPGAGSETATDSTLRWDNGLAYNIPLGAASVQFRLGNDDIVLLAPLRLPTMGGALLIRQMQLHDYGTPAASGLLDAELEPIQVGELAAALGWPAFSGTLSGRLPLLQLAEQTASIGGTLSARAFDGDIELSKLRIEQPFGLVPRLFGDIKLRNLDLRQITEAFSFGLIQGRLSGDVTGLQLENWKPVAMDMHFYTPQGDKSQRRISQRAVEDLASVGGGGAAALLSSGMLRFFDVFAYERIGLRCVLQDGACAMSGAGVGPQGQGFYIVKGSGVPRIDVVGFRDQVSWARLVRQLVAITNSGTPTLN